MTTVPFQKRFVRYSGADGTKVAIVEFASPVIHRIGFSETVGPSGWLASHYPLRDEALAILG
jgi:hypothetical protein